MEITIIRKKIKDNEYVYSLHAEIERKADELTFHQIEKALLNGKILEDYPDTGRGESCLVLGFSDDIPIHAVCGWRGHNYPLLPYMYPNHQNLSILGQGGKVWKRINVIFAEVQNTNNEGPIIYIPIRGITCWSQTHLWKSAKTAEWSIMMPVS